jgi:hypothetical protein
VNALARVSVAQIARETSLSERSVRRAIAGLEMQGVLSRLGGDEWVIHVDMLQAMPRIASDAS